MAAPITDVDVAPATQTLATGLSDQQLRQVAMSMAIELAGHSGIPKDAEATVDTAKKMLAFLKEGG